MAVYQNLKKSPNMKIPGVLAPSPKTEIDGKVTNLSSKTIPELSELRDRQLKLLNNKPFIRKLADEGVKIQNFHDKIVAELKAKQDEEHTCHLLDNLKLDTVDEQAVQHVEWEGEIKNNRPAHLDSDDDSDPEDVMHILSQSTTQEKIVKVIQPEKPLVTTDDLLKIGEIPHIKYLVNKTETNSKLKTTGNFKPFRTTKSDVHNPGKEILRKKHKHWEVTAATPPPIIHGPAKVLSLDESLRLQKEQNTHLKQIETMHAAEKLFARSQVKMAELPNNIDQFGRYREADSDNSASDVEGSDKEVHDEEPERGGVMFTVMK